MKKHLLLQVLFVFAFANAFAKNITEQQALIVGKNFYYEHINLQKPVDFKDIHVDNISKKTFGSTTLYYIINFTYQGYIVVSASDAVSPVLCYGFNSRYSELKQAPAFNHWMQDYEKQLRLVIEQNLPATTSVVTEWAKYLSENFIASQHKAPMKALVPLLHTIWDQGKYYNEYCPDTIGGPDGKCWSGCVPTAMGQIMNYYQWPKQGVGSYTYTHPSFGTLSANFANTNYYWESMPLEVTERSNDSAVATLLYHLGVSVDMDYGANGSGMFNHKAAYSLRTYFKYSPNCQYIFRDTATHTDWKQLIFDHLDQKKPLYYAGWADTNNISGHAFVCDGYQDTSYFHFNWGWGGSNDGYFMLDNLTPAGNDFTLDHELILNFYPDSTYENFNSCTTNAVMRSTKGTFGDGSGPLYNYKNNSDCQWLIQPNDSVTNIKLTFLEFKTESDSDRVIIYNGTTTTAPIIGTYSGSNLPSMITSTGKSMLVRFITNDSITSDGWLASYTTTTPIYCSGLKQYTAASGSFSDGSGSFKYHPNALCRWQMTPSGATSLLLHFNAFDIAPGDYVKVNDITNGIEIANLTGSVIPGDITCYSGSMQVLFKSYDKILAQGFSATYTVSNSIEDYNSISSDVIIAPNPATDIVNISFQNTTKQNITFTLFSMDGRVVYSDVVTIPAGNASQPLDVSKFKAGLYVLKISTTAETCIKKIILE